MSEGPQLNWGGHQCPDLGKAASGANGTCGHFVGNPAILRTFSVKYPVLLAENQGEKLRMEN